MQKPTSFSNASSFGWRTKKLYEKPLFFACRWIYFLYINFYLTFCVEKKIFLKIEGIWRNVIAAIKTTRASSSSSRHIIITIIDNNTTTSTTATTTTKIMATISNHYTTIVIRERNHFSSRGTTTTTAITLISMPIIMVMVATGGQIPPQQWLPLIEMGGMRCKCRLGFLLPKIIKRALEPIHHCETTTSRRYIILNTRCSFAGSHNAISNRNLTRESIYTIIVF